TVSGTASSGVDYTTLPGSVTIAAGLDSALITVSPIDDSISECPEMVKITLVSGPGYAVGSPNNDTVTIADNDLPAISLTAPDANAAEAALDPGSFNISRVGCTNSSLTINFKFTGTASNGVDYATLPSSVTIPAGATAAVLTVT